MIEIVNNGLVAGETLISYKAQDTLVTLPDEKKGMPLISRIGAGAMMYDNKVQRLNIQEGITEIGEKAFTGCRKLMHVSLPQSIKHIDSSAFSGLDKLKTVSFYADIGENEYQNIVNDMFPLTNGEYLIDPMILSRDIREWIYNVMPSALFKNFPVTEEMGYFFSSRGTYVLKSFMASHNLSGGRELADEHEAMKYRIFAGKERFLESGPDKGLNITPGMLDKNTYEIPSTALVFLTETLTLDNRRKIRIEVRREPYYFHTAYKVIVDGKPYYVCSEIYFQNKIPTYVMPASSFYICDSAGCIHDSDEIHERLLKKCEFVMRYL